MAPARFRIIFHKKADPHHPRPAKGEWENHEDHRGKTAKKQHRIEVKPESVERKKKDEEPGHQSVSNIHGAVKKAGFHFILESARAAVIVHG